MLCYTQVAPTISPLLLPCIPLSFPEPSSHSLAKQQLQGHVLSLLRGGVGTGSVMGKAWGQPCSTRGCRFVPRNETQPQECIKSPGCSQVTLSSLCCPFFRARSHHLNPGITSRTKNPISTHSHHFCGRRSLHSLGQRLGFDKCVESAGKAWKFLCKCDVKIGLK